MLCAALSILTLDYFFITPVYTFRLEVTDIFRLMIFGSVALLTSSLSDRLKRAKAQVERWNEDLELRVRERTEELSRTNLELKGEIQQRMQAEKAILEISSREQRRLSEDLHDGLCQMLAGIRLLGEEVKEKLSARAAPETFDMELLESRLVEALTQADNISCGLYPVELETGGLMAALQDLGDKMPRIYPVSCRFLCREPVLVHDATVATHLYRIAQEAMVNAIKGGKAKRITIRLASAGNQGLLSVADSGTGFDVKTAEKGMGLKMMNYRARLIGATLSITSRKTGGTRLQCRFKTDQKRLDEVGIAHDVR